MVQENSKSSFQKVIKIQIQSLPSARALPWASDDAMQGMATDEAKGVGQPTGLHIILINVEREWSPCAWQHTSTMTNEQINPWLLVNASMTTDCDLMPQKLQVLVAKNDACWAAVNTMMNKTQQ